jgi:hypothetical protein
MSVISIVPSSPYIDIQALALSNIHDCLISTRSLKKSISPSRKVLYCSARGSPVSDNSCREFEAKSVTAVLSPLWTPPCWGNRIQGWEGVLATEKEVVVELETV